MVRYAEDSGMTSAGVFMKLSTKGIIAMPMIVKNTAKMSVMAMEVWTVSRTLSYRFAP